MNITTEGHAFRPCFAGSSVSDGAGRYYRLSRENYLGSGKDGEVYKLNEHLAAKIYFENPIGERLREKLETLQAQNEHGHIARHAIAPIGMLHFADDGARNTAGFSMRYLPNAHTLRNLRWTPALESGQEGLFDAAISNILYELCSTLESLHGKRIFLCDMKPENILISEGSAWFIDLDSCAMPNYPGVSYTRHYLDPRLGAHGNSKGALSGVAAFSSESDWWALAVIAFELFMGYHPRAAGIVQEGDADLCSGSAEVREAILNHSGTHVRNANWLRERPVLLQYFVQLLSTKEARSSIAPALEQYFPRSAGNREQTRMLQDLEHTFRDGARRNFVSGIVQAVLFRALQGMEEQRAAGHRQFLDMMLDKASGR